MFNRYRILVLQDYEKKKAAGILPDSLVNPTPAGLRELCMTIYRERFEKKDETDLREFFEITGNAKELLAAMDGFDNDKLKPLAKFLKKETRSTERKNIKLLAWLIDFKDRPYDYRREYKEMERPAEPVPGMEQESVPGPLTTEPVTVQEVEIMNSGNSGNSRSSNNQENFAVAISVEAEPAFVEEPGTDAGARRNFFFRKWKVLGASRGAVLSTFVVLLCSLVVYLSSGKRKTGGGCMYWTGDHYEPISCHPRGPDTLVVALDSQKLKYFKRIKEPDTISYASIGKVWYAKYKNNIEYYTSDGWRPTEPKIKLKRLSFYMHEKYVLPLQQAVRAPGE